MGVVTMVLSSLLMALVIALFTCVVSGWTWRGGLTLFGCARVVLVYEGVVGAVQLRLMQGVSDETSKLEVWWMRLNLGTLATDLVAALRG
jgi:hypothetical protein